MNRRGLLLTSAVLLSCPLVNVTAETTAIVVDAAAKRSESAGIRMEMVFKGVGVEGIVFDAAFDTTGMDVPSLDTYDLSRRARLAVDAGAPIRPSSWTVRETGHMGHHLRGRLVFPSEKDGRPVLGPGAKVFEVRIEGIDGEARPAFSWKIAGR